MKYLWKDVCDCKDVENVAVELALSGTMFGGKSQKAVCRNAWAVA